jgi:surface antigen
LTKISIAAETRRMLFDPCVPHGRESKVKNVRQLTLIAAALALAAGAAYADSTSHVLSYGALRGSMDGSDKQNTIDAVATGQPATWRNESKGTDYDVQVPRTYENSAQTCRDYTIVAKAKDGSANSVKGTACKQADGGWHSPGGE